MIQVHNIADEKVEEESAFDRKLRLKNAVLDADLENVKALVGDLDCNFNFDCSGWIEHGKDGSSSCKSRFIEPYFS